MPIDPQLILPSVDDIATYIRSRVLDSGGNRHGTFTETTTPSDEQVRLIALRAARYVSQRLGEPDTDWTRDELQLATARDCAAVYAALTIENSFFTDGSSPDSAGVEQLGRMAREQLAALVATSKSNQPGGWRFHSLEQKTTHAPPSTGLQPEQIINWPEDGD